MSSLLSLSGFNALAEPAEFSGQADNRFVPPSLRLATVSVGVVTFWWSQPLHGDDRLNAGHGGGASLKVERGVEFSYCRRPDFHPNARSQPSSYTMSL